MRFSIVLLSNDVRNNRLLQSDALYNKLNERQKKEAINKAVCLGKLAAFELKKSFPNADVQEVLKQMGVNVVEDTSQYSEILPFSIYRYKSETIILYTNVVQKLAERLTEYSSLSKYEVLKRVNQIILYHELFHHMEKVCYGSVARQVQIPIFKLGFIRVQSGIKVLSEISAHTFVNECVGSVEQFLKICSKEVIENGL